jgi:hypothetical protein
MYKFIANPHTGEVSVIQRLSDSSFIPIDENNADYKTYKKWVDEGNKTIEPDSLPEIVQKLSAPLWKVKIILNRKKQLEKYDNFVSNSNNIELELFWDKADIVQSDSVLLKLIATGLKINDKTVTKLFEDANNLKV